MPTHTVLGSWTPEGKHLNHGDGPRVDRPAFLSDIAVLLATSASQLTSPMGSLVVGAHPGRKTRIDTRVQGSAIHNLKYHWSALSRLSDLPRIQSIGA
jgi:hypothetical protein